MKYSENMTKEELIQFKAEIDALNAAYESAAAHDAKVQPEQVPPDEWEDQADYVGMGWIDSRGRP